MRYDHFSMLPERAFQPRGRLFASGGMTLEGGGSSSPQPTSTSTTTIPEYAQPYAEETLGKASALTAQEYTPYQGERITPSTPEQQAARQAVASMTPSGVFQPAIDISQLSGLSAIGYGGQAAGFGQQAAGAGQQYMGMATSPEAQQAFMSPYMQNVVDIQKQEAIRDAQKGQLAANLGAARQGTYGGARQLLATTERERNLGQNLANIQAAGQQKAFEAAQQAQQFGSTLGLQGLQAGMQGAQTGIQGAGQAAQSAATMGQLGIGQQQQALDLAKAQETFGALGQAEQQKALDLAYQDYITQQQYPYKQLGFMSDILRGSANLAATGGKTVYEAAPSTASQLGGLGLGALGLYNLTK